MSDFPQRNPTLDKMSSRLGLAGSGSLSPVMAGLRGMFTFEFDVGESLTKIGVYNENRTTFLDWEAEMVDVYDADNKKYIKVTFGDADLTFTGIAATRNILEWTTNYGTCMRQFFIMDPPKSHGIYIDNQEAQSDVAKVFVDPTASYLSGLGQGEDLETTFWDRNMQFSMNMLPPLSDEFFRNQEYFNDAGKGKRYGNRYANTLRNWGGATTVEVVFHTTVPDDGSTGNRINPIVAEEDIEKVNKYFWGTVAEEDLTLHSLIFRFRALRGSSWYVDMGANLEVSRFPCS